MSRRLPSISWPSAPLGVVLTIVLAGCGGISLAARPCRTCAANEAGKPNLRTQAQDAAIAQTRADAYATVARRTYETEVNGPANGFAFYEIRRTPGLIDGLATRNYALARLAVRRQALSHAVAVRVTRRDRTLLDVGARFVIAGRTHQLHGAGGVSLGRVEVSTQAIRDFIREIRGLTGCQVVVEGSTGQTKSSFAGTAATTLPTTLPRRGPIVVAGRDYTVSSVSELGFAGEPIRIYVLDPARAGSGQGALTGGRRADRRPT